MTNTAVSSALDVVKLLRRRYLACYVPKARGYKKKAIGMGFEIAKLLKSPALFRIFDRSTRMKLVKLTLRCLVLVRVFRVLSFRA